jgi:hypothetical protein
MPFTILSLFSIVISPVVGYTHGWFKFNDVKQLKCFSSGINAKYLYGDVTGYSRIVSTKVPEYAIVSFSDKGTHGFTHNGKEICACFWDNEPTFIEKIQIAYSMMKWLKQSNSINHHIYDYEDGRILYLAKKYMESPALPHPLEIPPPL